MGYLSMLITGNTIRWGDTMNAKNRYVTWFMRIVGCILILSIISAIFIEKILSRRIHYKKPEFILFERNKMIEEYGGQAIALTTVDNQNISALYIKRPEAKRIFLVCHGFKHSKEYTTGFLELFPEDSIFFIDFRGHGQSQGDRVSLGLNEYLDVVAAADYIKKNISSTAPLFGIGISLGGSAVLRAAAAGAPFDAVISDSAPSSFKDTVACILQKSRHIPYPIGWLALTWYELIMGQFLSNSCYTHYAAKITCPVLIMHDEYDHLIDFGHAQKIFDSLGSTCKLLWNVTGTRHGKMHKQIPEKYKKVVDGFIAACVK
jgi:pimeloyl-ACP methyl ester carboxylesterase